MPIYEYRCSKCHKTFEKFQKITDKPLAKCKDCGGKTEKLISQTSFSLRGGGWYKDGYNKKAKEEPSTQTEEKKKDTSKTKEEKGDKEKV